MMIADGVGLGCRSTTLRVITCASGCANAAAPSLGQRAHDVALRQDADDALLRTEHDERADPRSREQFAIASSSVAVGSMVMTLLPLVDRMALTFMGRLLDRQNRPRGPPANMETLSVDSGFRCVAA